MVNVVVAVNPEVAPVAVRVLAPPVVSAIEVDIPVTWQDPAPVVSDVVAVFAPLTRTL
jgi:hypothetical protein